MPTIKDGKFLYTESHFKDELYLVTADKAAVNVERVSTSTVLQDSDGDKFRIVTTLKGDEHLHADIKVYQQLDAWLAAGVLSNAGKLPIMIDGKEEKPTWS